MTLDIFKTVIKDIIDQEEIDNKFGKSLETVCDSWCLFNANNKMYSALFLTLKDYFNDKDDWISWWLFESDGVEREVIYKDGTTKSVRTVEELYTFLIENMKGKKK